MEQNDILKETNELIFHSLTNSIYFQSQDLFCLWPIKKIVGLKNNKGSVIILEI